jgi:hypothetical protein
VTGPVPVAGGSRGLPRSALLEERVGLLEEGTEFDISVSCSKDDRQQHDLIRKDVVKMSCTRRRIERAVEQYVLPGFNNGADQGVPCSGLPRRAGALIILRDTNAGVILAEPAMG